MADSGDSSPLSAAATDDPHHDNNNPNPSDPAVAAVAAAQTALPPPPPAKVRLMVSYGGRIQPRPHDNQLSYVNGDTKILSVERPLPRFPDFAARLAALAGTTANAAVCVKYQLPGEDLDALVSVTNDEDLDHLVIEYDRLHLFRNADPGPGSGSGSSRGGSTPRLRVFLFPVLPPPPPPPAPLLQPNAALDPPKQDQQRDWYGLDLRSASPTLPPHQQQMPQSHQKQQETILVHSPPHAVPVPVQSVMLSQRNLDILYGLDCSFVPPPSVKVKDPAGEPPAARENVPVEIPNPKFEIVADSAMLAPVISPTEYHRQIQEKLQLADSGNQHAPPATAPVAVQQPPPAPAPAPVAAAQQQPPPAPAPVAAAQHNPPAPATAQLAAQHNPPAPAPLAAQHNPPAPAPLAAQHNPPAPAPAPPTPVAPAAPVATVAQVAAPLSRNGSDDSLTRAYPPATATTTAPPEYYLPKFPEKPPVTHPSSAPPTAFLPVPPGRYASVSPGAAADHGQFYYIPGPPPGYYASTNHAGTSYYAVAPPHNGHNGNGNGNGTAPAPAMSTAQPYPQVAYDSNGRPVFYTGILPQYPSAVNGMSASAAVLGSEPSKPVAVKPTVS